MFLKIIRLISVCAICLYLWTISNNREVSAGYYEEYLYVMSYTKLRRMRNDLITLYSLLAYSSYLLPFAIISPVFLFFPSAVLLLTRCFSMLRMLRPYVHQHHNYSYEHFIERQAFHDYDHAAKQLDDVLQVVTMVGICMINLKVLFG